MLQGTTFSYCLPSVISVERSYQVCHKMLQHRQARRCSVCPDIGNISVLSFQTRIPRQGRYLLYMSMSFS